MPAYFISDVHVTDRETFNRYAQAAGPFVTKYGGRPLTILSPAEVVAGDWQPEALSVFEFPDAGHIRQWMADPEYQAVAELRLRSATTKAIIVEGFWPGR